MVRTQVYLTEHQREKLSALSAETGKPQSELIRRAIDEMIVSESEISRARVLEDTAGMWSDRTDLPDFDALRREWDRA